MRTIYLIRHAEPDAPHNLCGYAEDVGLCEVGRKQAARLPEAVVSPSIIFCSPLRRAAETARILSRGAVPVIPEPELREVDTGLWTGLTFNQIQSAFPEEYARRGAHLGDVPPPGGESFSQAAERMQRCMTRLLAQSAGDIAVVAHAGINRSWLCRLTGQPMDSLMRLRQPRGGVSTVRADSAGAFRVLSVGLRPDRYPDDDTISELLARCGTPSEVIAHGKAVADCAAVLAAQSAGQPDTGLLRAACLLHDLVRARSNHAAEGARILDREGYPECAAVIAAHHDLPEDAGIEAQLLYLADKLVQGSERVSLAERFARSRKRCTSPEALFAWEARYQAALRVAERLHLEV